MYKVIPQAAYNDLIYQIWPIDGWSRKTLLTHCETQNIPYETVTTTMGEPAFQFDAEIYYQLKQWIQDYK